MRIKKKTKLEKTKELCKYPKCKKEVHDIGAKFCGEHQRTIENTKDTVLKVGAAAAASVALAIIKPIRDKFDI